MKNIAFGLHSVEALLKTNPSQIKNILIEENSRNNRLQSLVHQATNNQIEIEYVKISDLNKISQTEKHQGVIAFLTGINNSIPLKQLINQIQNKPNSLILILDGITDPQNLGAIIRTAECFAVDAIILPKDNSANINNPAVIKVASGAINYIPVITVTNLIQAIELLKEAEFWIAGTGLSKNSVNLFEFKFSGKLAWVLGNEEKGIRRLVAENCDYLVTIPMLGNTQSLNVSVCAGIVIAYTRFIQPKLC